MKVDYIYQIREESDCSNGLPLITTSSKRHIDSLWCKLKETIGNSSSYRITTDYDYRIEVECKDEYGEWSSYGSFELESHRVFKNGAINMRLANYLKAIEGSTE